MPRYIIFEKDSGFNYPFRDFATGKNPNDALQNRIKRGGYPKIYPNRIYMVVPVKSFMKFQYNPQTIGKEKIKKEFGNAQNK